MPLFYCIGLSFSDMMPDALPLMIIELGIALNRFCYCFPVIDRTCHAKMPSIVEC